MLKVNDIFSHNKMQYSRIPTAANSAILTVMQNCCLSRLTFHTDKSKSQFNSLCSQIKIMLSNKVGTAVNKTDSSLSRK